MNNGLFQDSHHKYVALTINQKQDGGNSILARETRRLGKCCHSTMGSKVLGALALKGRKLELGKS